MSSVSIRTARQKMSSLIEEVQSGGAVTITKRGRDVARIVPIRPAKTPGRLPDLTAFRKSIKPRGQALAAEVRSLRREERF